MLPFLLILKEPDLGSALVLLPTGLVMMLVAGTPRRFLLRLIGGVGIVAVLCLMDILFLPNGPLAGADAGIPAQPADDFLWP